MIEIYHKRLYIEGQMSSIRQIGIMGLLTVMIVAGGGAGWWMRANKTGSQAVAGTSVPEKRAVIIVNTGEKRIEKTVENIDGMTALDATREAADGQMEVSGTGGGAFVTGIAGRNVKAENKEFWEMMINNQPAVVGAGTYVVQPGDTVEWRVSTY
jgi:hypothetical protein